MNVFTGSKSKNGHKQNMEETTYVPFYSVYEEVYRNGYTEGKLPIVRDTDFRGYDLHTARHLAFGLVAKRWRIVNKLQNREVLPSEEPKLEIANTVADEESWNHFNQDDDVVWKIEITTGDNYPEDWLMVYNSEDDADKTVRRLLMEARLLSDYTMAKVVTTS